VPVAAHSEKSHNQTLLVVEDNIDSAALLSILLKEEGYRVLLAHDGQQGLDMARQLRPDVILMDIGLPLMDGWIVARMLREDGSSQTVMVAMSGYGQPDDLERSLKAGFDLHLTKPLDLNALLNYLNARRKAVPPKTPGPTTCYEMGSSV